MPSGMDPRGRIQNQGQYQQRRYESQQGPMANIFGYNYGRGSESDYNNYQDIMNRFRDFSGGGGGGGYSGISHSPLDKIGYKDPFNSYSGYQEFSKTGGYSPEDMANMRARGVSPIRAAYANAGREVGRQRSLQGGYSPNAIATQARMAREQGQAGADAMQNVEAGLAEARNRGRQFGLQGMSGIEGQRLGADLDVGKFNVSSELQRRQLEQNDRQFGYNAGQENNRNRLSALLGMSQLYGTSPGMSQAFGNQLLQGVGQGGNFGLGMMGNSIQGQQLPGAWDQTMGRTNDIADLVNMGSNAIYPWLRNRQKKPQQQQYPFTGPMQDTGDAYDFGG